MTGEGIGQAQRRGELRAEQARSQYPQWHMAPLARHRADAEPLVAGKEGLQFDHVLRELPLIARQRPAQRLRDALVRSRRAPEPKVDAPRRSEEHTSELQSLMRI